MRRAWILVVLAVGCKPQSNFECTVDAQCQNNDVAGVCEENGFCSFPDPTCPSGRRFGDLAGGLANMCVPATFDTEEPMSTSSDTTAGPPSSSAASETMLPDESSSSTGGAGTSSSTGSACEELCLDYQPEWQLPIQNCFVDLARLPSGELLLVGGYNGAISVGTFDLPTAGDPDLFLAWMDDEAVQNVIPYSSVGTTHVLGLAVDPSARIYVAGTYSGAPSFGGPALTDGGGGYVVAFEDNGDYRWAVPMAGTARVWEVDHDGNSLLAVGDYENTVTIGPEMHASAGSSDGFLVRLHQDGNVIVQHHVTGPGLDFGTDVVVTGDGYVAVGMFSEMFTGGDTVSVQGTADGWVQRLSTSAVPEWTRSFGGGIVQWPAVDADAAGNLYVMAMFSGTVAFDDGTSYESTVSDDIVIAKLGPDGAHQWSQAIPTAGAARSWDVDATADGRVAFTYSYGSSTTVAGQDFVSAGESDGILVVYDTDGNAQFVTTYSGDLDETGANVMLEDNNDLTAIFTYQSATIDIGLGPANGPGDGMNYAALVVHYPAP